MVFLHFQIFVKEENTQELDNSEKMVGEASSYVETGSTCASIAEDLQADQSISDSSTSTFPLIPTVTLNSSGPITFADNVQIKKEPVHDTEMVYGTYDEATNCITIIYPEEEDVDMTHLSPKQYQQQLNSPSHSYGDSMSPVSTHSEDTEMMSVSDVNNKFDSAHSDVGYESHGSPASSISGANNASLDDLWHESFSELFPSLA